MSDRVSKSNSSSNMILERLEIISKIAGILLTFLSLFLEEKIAKQLSFSLAIVIPIGVSWYQRQKISQLKLLPAQDTTSTKAAERLLKQYIAFYQRDPAVRIPFSRLQWIEKNAQKKLLSNENAAKLIDASRASFYWITGTNLTLGVLLLIALYAFLTTNYRFNPVDYFFGRRFVQEENPFIPLDSGDGTMIFGTEDPSLESGEQPLNENMPITNFSIQKTEVTNKQYRICQRGGGCKFDPIPSPTSPRYYEDTAYDNFPIVGVSAFDARQFCIWLGGDLPTSFQWERAARGLHGRSWPWQGSDLTPDLANLYPSEGLMNANDFPNGRSPEGVLNLVGNVAEWTRTQMITKDDGASFLPELWNGIDKDIALTLRGGSWGLQMSRITDSQIAIPENYSEFIGFRCAISK